MSRESFELWCFIENDTTPFPVTAPYQHQNRKLIYAERRRIISEWDAADFTLWISSVIVVDNTLAQGANTPQAVRQTCRTHQQPGARFFAIC
jgi:hypothetical protein